MERSETMSSLEQDILFHTRIREKVYEIVCAQHGKRYKDAVIAEEITKYIFEELI